MHASFLRRSNNKQGDSNVPKRGHKLKHEIGINFPKDYYYPEVFFRTKPSIVKSPWERMDRGFYLKSLVQTPLRRIKRRLVWGGVGY